MAKQKHMAKLLNITQSHVSMIFSGHRNFTYPMAKKMRNLTGINTDFWMEAKPKELKKAFESLDINHIKESYKEEA